MRTRNEDGYRNTESKNGVFSPHISKATATRLTKWCARENINKTRFVESCINEKLDMLEEEFLQSLTKEELIEIIKKG